MNSSGRKTSIFVVLSAAAACAGGVVAGNSIAVRSEPLSTSSTEMEIIMRNTPKGYLIAQVTVTNQDAYSQYTKAASSLLREYGAKTFVNPDTAIVVEGQPKQRTVIFEFDSFEQVKQFWNSPAYEEVKQLRQGAADADFILIEGNN